MPRKPKNILYSFETIQEVWVNDQPHGRCLKFRNKYITYRIYNTSTKRMY